MDKNRGSDKRIRASYFPLSPSPSLLVFLKSLGNLRISIRVDVLVLSLAGLSLLAGCTGRATVHTVPFMRKQFAPNEMLVHTVNPNEAYYWLDDDGKLNVVLKYKQGSLLGPAFEIEWLMSMVLEGLPAGSERLYELRRPAVRIVQSRGGDHRRSQSLRGIAVIYAPQGGRLKGRFHVTIQQQQFHVLQGWSRGGLMVSVGEFEAVENAIAGQEILKLTEADGFERRAEPSVPPIQWLTRPPSVTQPASQPAVVR